MELPEWIIEILKESPTLVVCLLVIWFAQKKVIEEHEKHLHSKDREIERLVDERNSLQNIILKKRLSTQNDRSTGPGD